MAIAEAIARPLAFAVTAQVERDGMFDRHTALYQRIEKMIPTAPLVTHPVHENVCVLLRISPFPIMKFQAIVFKVALPWFQNHKLLIMSLLPVINKSMPLNKHYRLTANAGPPAAKLMRKVIFLP